MGVYKRNFFNSDTLHVFMTWVMKKLYAWTWAIVVLTYTATVIGHSCKPSDFKVVAFHFNLYICRCYFQYQSFIVQCCFPTSLGNIPESLITFFFVGFTSSSHRYIPKVLSKHSSASVVQPPSKRGVGTKANYSHAKCQLSVYRTCGLHTVREVDRVLAAVTTTG